MLQLKMPYFKILMIFSSILRFRPVQPRLLGRATNFNHLCAKMLEKQFTCKPSYNIPTRTRKEVCTRIPR
jgi:hypothetical protein